jgi:hypothetical protein
MLVVASILLVAVALATLVVGILVSTMSWVFVSIGCTLLAGAALYGQAHLERRVTV